jgi:lysophospholipase L1-like esterase
LLPYENETYHPGAWTPAGEEKRQIINAWIRQGGAFDAVIDFDEALRDPAHPSSMLPAYDCDDHLHPSDNGYRRMGDSIDLKLFA